LKTVKVNDIGSSRFVEMCNMNVQLSVCIALAYLFLIPVRVLAQESVLLRSTVRLAAGARVTIGDVAVLKGEQAALLEDVVVAGKAGVGGSEVVVDLAAVRAAVERAAAEKGSKINVGRITFGGSVCRVMGALEFEQACTPEKRAGGGGESFVDHAEAVGAGQTVRSAIADKVAATAGVSASDVRLAFDARDDNSLNESTVGRTVAITNTGGGEKLSFGVRLYENDTLVTRVAVRVGVLVRRDVAVARQIVARGDVIGAENIEVQEQWLSLAARAANPKSAMGATARSRIGVGEVVEPRDIEASVAVKKGDIVSLHCLSGGVEVRTTARALATGKEGESILFETMEWKTNVLGKISAGGHAVAIAPMGKGEAKTRPKRQMANSK